MRKIVILSIFSFLLVPTAHAQMKIRTSHAVQKKDNRGQDYFTVSGTLKIPVSLNNSLLCSYNEIMTLEKPELVKCNEQYSAYMYLTKSRLFKNDQGKIVSSISLHTILYFSIGGATAKMVDSSSVTNQTDATGKTYYHIAATFTDDEKNEICSYEKYFYVGESALIHDDNYLISASLVNTGAGLTNINQVFYRVPKEITSQQIQTMVEDDKENGISASLN